MVSRLADLYASCHGSFQALLSAVRSPKRDIGNQMSPRDVESELDKLILWANNVGAIYSGDLYEISLDYRLRKSPFYQERVVSFLNSLNKYLVRATQIIQDETKPFEEMVDVDLSVEAFDSTTSSSTISDPDSDTSEEQDENATKRHSEGSDASSSARSNNLELPKTLELIHFIINCLYKMPIRRPAALERITERITTQFTPYQQYDAQFVRDLHPELDATIAARLGRLVSLRRQMLAYQERHNQKLQPERTQHGLSSRPIGDVDPGVQAVVYTTPPSEQPSGISRPSKATTHQNPPDRPDLQKFDYPPSIASSHHSRASSYAINSIGLSIPPIPKSSDGTLLTNFRCPYCNIAQYIESERSWKNHVLHDLQPYVCTFSGCSLQDHFFPSRNAWYLHETQEHRCVWHCNVDGHGIYKTQELFMDHMSQSHGTKLSWEQMANLVPMFRRSDRSSSGQCNLCFRKSKSLCDHVARHLERIALFALPRSVDDDAESKSSQNQQSLEALLSDDESRPASAELEPSDKVSVSQSTSQTFGRNAERLLFEDEVKLSDLSQNLVPDSEDINWDVVTTQFSGEPGAMRNRPSFSVLRTSVSMSRKAQCEELAQKLQDAVERTTKDVAEDDVQRSAFLPKPDLDQILNARSLKRLFTQLMSENSVFGGRVFPKTHAINIADEEKGSDSVNDHMFINSCIDATKRKPRGESSWRTLLALFLYQNNKELLSLFLEWMAIIFEHPTAKSNNLIPSDKSIPFTKATLQEYKVPNWCHRLILLDQAIFRPVMIQKLKHHDITTSERLPFMGGYQRIESGSQGQFFKTEIAQCHWEIRQNEDQKDSDLIPGNPISTKVVALKVFKAAEPARNMLEATEDFNIELSILEGLRTYKTKHKMIMLHLGSITELDGAGRPTRHSIIFDLASFSLGDLLRGRNHPQEAVRPSRLLASLVGIIEALECLHVKLETLHLDIKPDNILIFETRSGSGDEEQHELIWKLSNFGLALKEDSKQRAVSARPGSASSQASTVPATRPAGLYQAPEIQELDASQAGRGSDVWSMGCITLMVLAFIYGGSKEVTELESSLMVRFQNLGGREPLFYIRSDSYPWKHRTSHICHYLQSRDPGDDVIPHTAGPLRAALHPSLIDWSNILVEDSYAFRKEQKFVTYILRVIVGGVLLIDRSKRMGASDLRDKLAYIQQEWEKYDLAPGYYVHPEDLAELSLPQRRNEPIYEPMPEPITGAEPSTSNEDILPTAIAEHRMHDELSHAIQRDDAPSVRVLIERNHDMLKQLSPVTRRYPIHWALFQNAYNALDALLEKATPETTALVCNGRTALDLAMDGGKPAALDCIRKHRNKFEFPAELYEKRKKNLGWEAREIADDLFGVKKRASRRIGDIFKFRKSRAHSPSA